MFNPKVTFKSLNSTFLEKATLAQYQSDDLRVFLFISSSTGLSPLKIKGGMEIQIDKS